MPRIAWGARCASIPRKRRSLGMRRPTGCCMVVIAHLILCRKRFDLLRVTQQRRPKLAMRISIAGVFLTFVFAVAFLTSFVSAGPHPPDRITVAVNEKARGVDVSIDGQPFTSYIWPTALKKPVFYPLRTAKGTIITRGFPLR